MANPLNGFLNAWTGASKHIVGWWFTHWTDPWMWMVLGLGISVLVILGTKPFAVPAGKDTVGLGTYIAVFLRRLSVWMLASVPIVSAFVYVIAGSVYGFEVALSNMLDRIVDRFMYWWELPATLALASVLLVVSYRRFVVPKVSAWSRQFRLKQTGEELSDIRVEQGNFDQKKFLPSTYYRPDQVFFGLDQTNQPIYIPLDGFRKMHMKIIGPTQTGKGVLLGVLADQAIRRGECVIVIDPKPDYHLKEIMRAACEQTGRKFMELDLNDGSKHRWAPFAGGTARDRRSRLLSAFGLADTGESADYYKAGERSLLDQLLPTWSGDLQALKNLIIQNKLNERMSRTVSYLDEWLAVPTFRPAKGRGFTIEKAMRDNAVVWVRAHLADTLIIKAATIFIMEVIQEGMRLFKNGRTSHLFFPIDEVRFMVSDTLANALATVAGFQMNCALAYQSILDLRALRDKNVNAKSIEESINVNCKISICYQATNDETAEWGSLMSGTIQKAVTRMETVKTGRYGAEEWEDERMVGRTEVPLISKNVLRSLPTCVGVLFQPNKLATLLYTAWIPVTVNEESLPLPAPEPNDTLDEVDPTAPPLPISDASKPKKKGKRKATVPDELVVPDESIETAPRGQTLEEFDDYRPNDAIITSVHEKHARGQ